MAVVVTQEEFQKIAILLFQAGRKKTKHNKQFKQPKQTAHRIKKKKKQLKTAF